MIPVFGRLRSHCAEAPEVWREARTVFRSVNAGVSFEWTPLPKGMAAAWLHLTHEIAPVPSWLDMWKLEAKMKHLKGTRKRM